MASRRSARPEGVKLSQIFVQDALDNGLVVLGERMPWLGSVAVRLFVPAGSAREPEGRFGIARVLADLIEHGAGERTHREIVEALDFLGVSFDVGGGTYSLIVKAAMPADKLPEVLPILADLVRRPHLPDEDLDDVRRSALQDLRALDDDPGGRMSERLRLNTFGPVFGRSDLGRLEDLEALTGDDVRAFYRDNVGSTESIFSIAGQFDWPAVRDQVRTLFGDWGPVDRPQLPTAPGTWESCHITHQSAQTHIGLSWPSVPLSDDDSLNARGILGILGGGMSSRLFEEVRERRGLCYSVDAGYSTLRDRACGLATCGTTAERAQESLDTMLAEIGKLADGFSDEELARLKTQLRSGLIAQQESCHSRASALAANWIHYGRLRTMDEISARIQALTRESLAGHLERYPATAFSIVTLGPEPLEQTRGVSR